MKKTSLIYSKHETEFGVTINEEAMDLILDGATETEVDIFIIKKCISEARELGRTVINNKSVNNQQNDNGRN